MRARFIGDPRNGGEGADLFPAYGVEFVKGEWTEVPASLGAKIAGNNHFETDADEDGEPGPTVDELRAQLTERGIKFHHKAGVGRLLELLAGSEG